MMLDDVRAQLSAYLDGELGEAERRAVEAALEAEPGLRAELEALRRTVRLVRSLPRATAPAGFRQRVEAAIARGDAARRRRPSRRWLAGALAAAACLLVAAAALLHRAQHPREAARALDPASPAAERAAVRDDRYALAPHEELAQAKPDAAVDAALRRQAPGEQPDAEADKAAADRAFGYGERQGELARRANGAPVAAPAAPALRPHEPGRGLKAGGAGLRGGADLALVEKKGEALAEQERDEGERHRDARTAPEPKAAKPSATMAAKNAATPAPAPALSKPFGDAPAADAEVRQGGELAKREGAAEEAQDADGLRRRSLESDSLVAAITRERAAAAPPRAASGGQRAIGAAGQATRKAKAAGDALEAALAYTDLAGCLAEVSAALDAAEVPYTVQPEGGGRFVVETRLPAAAARALVAHLQARLSAPKDLEKAEQKTAAPARARESGALFKGKIVEAGPAVHVVLHFERAATPAAEAAPQK